MKNLSKFLLSIFSLIFLLIIFACTDYKSDYEDEYGYILASDENETEGETYSSSNEINSSSSSESSFSSSSFYSNVNLIGSCSSVDFRSSSSSISSSSYSVKSSSSVSNSCESTVKKGTMTDERDGQIYKTVTIGSQTWMAENLNYAYNESNNYLDSSSFCYDNKLDSCIKYGRLYPWNSATNSSVMFDNSGKYCTDGIYCGINGNVQGVCPDGWHLPSENEWLMLFSAAGGASSAGTKLVSSSGWYDGLNGDDCFDFSVLPAGLRGLDGFFYNSGEQAIFWSSTESNSDSAHSIGISRYYAKVFNDRKIFAYSVRCVKNTDDIFVESSSSSYFNSNSSINISSSTNFNEYSSSCASSSGSNYVVDPSSVIKGTMTDERDGQTYKTVTIGTQTWMAENLNHIPDTTVESYDSYTMRTWCYENSVDSCAKYGRLYTWYAAMVSCPNSWHVPNLEELDTLLNAVGGIDFAGTALKSASGWRENYGKDSYGFSVLPAGTLSSGIFCNVGISTSFWSSLEYGNGNIYAYHWSFTSSDYVFEYYSNKENTHSVRCIKDSD